MDPREPSPSPAQPPLLPGLSSSCAVGDCRRRCDCHVTTGCQESKHRLLPLIPLPETTQHQDPLWEATLSEQSVVKTGWSVRACYMISLWKPLKTRLGPADRHGDLDLSPCKTSLVNSFACETWHVQIWSDLPLSWGSPCPPCTDFECHLGNDARLQISVFCCIWYCIHIWIFVTLLSHFTQRVLELEEVNSPGQSEGLM